MNTTTTSVAESFPQVYGYDGYDYLEHVERRGWITLASWGRDGWDFGDWPYVQYAIRRMTRHVAERDLRIMAYCEGDITIYDPDTPAEFFAKLDELAMWGWLRDVSDDDARRRLAEDPARRGPYSGYAAFRDWYDETMQTV